MDTWKNIPTIFNARSYISLNDDLADLSEEQARCHYEYYGYYENRKYSILPDDFNYIDYLELNPDIKANDQIGATLHYENHGYYEKRKYKKNDNITDPNLIKPSNTEIPDFFKYYNTTLSQLKTDDKMNFRYICYNHIPYIRNITLPDISVNSKYEAVLIEYRCFPHLEFIIRNNILKLGNKWSFTVICGNLNYEFMTNMCNHISQKIKVIRTNYNNLSPSQYSKFLSKIDFWNFLIGKKLLLYQEDSIVFKNNIEDFLYFDYIGAPWVIGKNDNLSGVGNGGVSLRTKDIMIQVINTKSMDTTIFNSNTLEYMKNTKSYVPPEDVYFTKNMEDFNIGILADRNSATKFSCESIFYEDSFAGHGFWISDPKWTNKLDKFNIVKFRPNYDLSFLEHRGGWKTILLSLKENMFFSKSSTIDFFDVIESKFLWDTAFVCDNKWCGVMHCTPTTPDYLNIINLNCMFENPNFIKSLQNCVFIISLSPYLTKYLNKKIKCDLNLNVPVYTLMHPVVTDNIPLFNISEFIQNENKFLIQVGQQLRKITSIYRLNEIECSKLWLTGTQNFDKMKDLLNKEINYLQLNKHELSSNVTMYYTKTFEEYDNLLSKNLVFVDLFDAAANNTVLECIVRNTPIIINKIEGVVDYLGEDYPLYYTKIEDVKNLINTQKILEAHEYLKQIDKTPFMISTFLNGVFDIVNKHFLYNV